MRKLINNKLFNILCALLLALSVGMLAGCEEQGPAEEAGEEIDEAVEEAGDDMEEAAEEVEDEVDDATGGG
jgi:outer membrane lipoprotein-sorting protein